MEESIKRILNDNFENIVSRCTRKVRRALAKLKQRPDSNRVLDQILRNKLRFLIDSLTGNKTVSPRSSFNVRFEDSLKINYFLGETVSEVLESQGYVSKFRDLERKISRVLKPGIPEKPTVEPLWERSVVANFLTNQDLLPELERLSNVNEELVRLNEDLQKRFEEAERELERHLSDWQTAEYLRGLIRYSPNAIVTVDAQANVLSWNEAARDVTGYSLKEIREQSTFKIFADPEEARELLAKVETEGFVRSHEIDILRKDGSQIPVSISVGQMGKGHENLAQLVIIFSELSEIKEIRAKLVETEKMSALGKITASVAHEIRNPLNSLFLNVDLLEDEISSFRDVPLERTKALMTVVREEIDRLKDIINSYLTLSKLPAMQLENKKINEVLCKFVEDIKPEAKANRVRIIEHYGKNLPKVSLDENQFRRVLFNIFKNSLEAMPDGGELSITTRKNGRTVKILMTDSGIGIVHEHLPKLFSAFYSLKNEGTGLGLYLVREIVQAHRGTVVVRSEVGKGTTVMIDLPVST